MKLKTVYVCQSCEAQSVKWAGKCTQCGSWNSFVEDVINVGKEAKNTIVRPRQKAVKPVKVTEIKKRKERLVSGLSEVDQVLGGGFVDGSLVLLSGEPGIGKSTITLQIVDHLSHSLEKVLYITGEESVEQVADRATRLGNTGKGLQLMYESNLENILTTIESEKPDFLVIDSIQVMSSGEISGMAGGLSQVRYVTEMIMNSIKTHKIPTLLIGHVNKDGKIAGPKVLEHLVDTVLILEGERDQTLRMLRAVKNRYGNVSEVGLFQMEESGLKEITNPGAYVLENRPKNPVGSCLTVTMEGNRPLLMEIQALVTASSYGYPKRASIGFDRNRLELLIAVLQKHSTLNLAEQDVYINVVGGLKMKDPAADLAVCLAIASSLKKIALPNELVAFGEVGLTGEIRVNTKQSAREKLCKKSGLEIAETQKPIREIVKLFTK
jgi:DNA repair protein RadA/Sms